MGAERDKTDFTKFTLHHIENERRKSISYEVEGEEMVEEIVSRINYFMVRIRLRNSAYLKKRIS